MSIFGSIASAIFGGPAAAATTPTAAAPAPGTPAAAGANVDVAAILDKLEEASDEDFDWRKSIVDLMKLLKLDSSLTARKALATELKYTGDMSDSATMNVWLHKQVMTKLAANGGVVPPELKD
ncbi:MAG: DUF3597 domain-containing protein [Hyphomicrobiaceae bacterium]|nr:DUF3597 domain-containing protein [Hyphomicrobiaceae bacterium]